MDGVFHEGAPKIDGPRLLWGMAADRESARGEIQAAEKIREATKRIFGF
jgi:hypothetical protein